MMANVDVSKAIDTINITLTSHSEILNKITETIVKQAETSATLVNMESRIAESDVRFEKRLDKMEFQITANRTTILKWGGALTALLGVPGIVFMLIKITESAG